MTISLPTALHNVTQEAEVLNVLHDFTVRSIVPAALLESFLLGTSSVCVAIHGIANLRGLCRRLYRWNLDWVVHVMVSSVTLTRN